MENFLANISFCSWILLPTYSLLFVENFNQTATDIIIIIELFGCRSLS